MKNENKNSLTGFPKYPDSYTDPELFVAWADRLGVKVDKSGLIIPKENHNKEYKISPNFLETIQKVDEAREKGKYVIILPGRYDLAHIGHLSFLVQAINAFLKAKSTFAEDSALKRSDIFVLVLLDDDDLIRLSIGEGYIKYFGVEGPIEKFNKGQLHPRIRTAAELPVDLVGFLPSPFSKEQLPKPTVLKLPGLINALKRSRFWQEKTNEAEKVLRALENYDVLRERVSKSGKDLRFDLIWWSLELWQLYLLSSMNKHEVEGKKYRIQLTRIVSKREHEYFQIVHKLMKYSKIIVLEINDVFCMSTRQIVGKLGVARCLDIKKAAVAERL